MIWLAGDDEPKVEYFRRMPILEYYRLLDMKIEATEKMEEESKKKDQNKPGIKGRK